MENATNRPLGDWIRNRSKEQSVTREDGAKQTASAGEWDRRAMNMRGNASKADVRAFRETLEQRREALDSWQRRDAQGRYFQGADAQTRMSQLESNGDVRTGPTAWEKWWDGVKKALMDGFLNLMRRLFGGLGRVAPSSIPTVDPTLIQVLFYLAVLSLLGAILYFLWRALGPHLLRLRRPEARRKVKFIGEDAELLQLPPDELLERARAFAAQGNFHEALRHLYIRLLLQLDARGVWRYDTRRTNWEHIAGLRQNAAYATLAKPLGDLTHRFDRVRYGNAPCSGDDWTRFERDALAVENSISPNS